MYAIAREPAYQWGSTILFAAVAVILGALAIEWAGYRPCELCLQQRYAYYAGIPAIFASLILLSAGQRRWAALVLFLVSLAFLANSGFALYHAGIEWKLWPGPATCAAGDGAAALPKAGGVLGALAKTNVVPCGEPALLIAGLSLAAWNAVISLMLGIGALGSAFAATSVRD